MPNASAELRAEWLGSDEQAIGHLRSAGYRLTSQWGWLPPSSGGVPTERDMSAINYLIDEWDFDGLILKQYVKEKTDTSV